jgi:hypothetical protein
MLERLKQLWRSREIAPDKPMTAENYKAWLLERFQTDSEKCEIYRKMGVTEDMLKRSEFNLKEYLIGYTFRTAIERAYETEEGRNLFAEASEFKPGTDELFAIRNRLIKRFGNPRLERLLESIPD